MKTPEAVQALAALAHETRLEVFRALVQAGPEGLAAGAIADLVGVPAPTLSFHLKELLQSGIVLRQRHGRSLIYSADYDAMGGLVQFLTEQCCRGFETARAG